jgi:7-carboxy-7-deazaguanine synthase
MPGSPVNTDSASLAWASLKHPVVEIFGPTIQGEGILVGMPVYFVRFGGCDYRCSWCDTKYAVQPSEVKRNSTLMAPHHIAQRIQDLQPGPKWIIFSGGNPALQHLDELIDLLHYKGYKVMIETQGTVYRQWIRKVDNITISPKPPSSGNTTSMDTVDAFRHHFAGVSNRLSYKVVVFDEYDLEYLTVLVKHLEGLYPVFLSIGTDVQNDTADKLLRKWRYWAETLARDRVLGEVRVLAQCHVLLFGQRRGV